MRPYGRGILPASQIYLFDASEQARRMFFYPLCVGHYECGADYIVSRPNYDSYLLLYVKNGMGYYCTPEGRRVELPPDSFVLIDCYEPHEYGAVESSEIYWVHFDGPTANDVCGQILSRQSFVPKNPGRCRDTLVELFERKAGGGHVEEAVVNRMIVGILTEFLVASDQEAASDNGTIDDIRNYILDNPTEDLTLETLARRASLSPYHFARTFKRAVGVSPHEFVIHARLNLATFYLKSSDDPIKEIAYNCGFSNECSFCATFKKRLGTTPTSYRLDYRSK